MALVGEAHILVKAITTGVKNDIDKGFNGVDNIGSRVGKSLGGKFANAFRGTNGNVFKRFSAGIKAIEADSRKLATAWTSLQRTGFGLQAGIGTLLGSIGALIGGLGALVGALGGAAVAGVALIGTFVSLKIASMAAKMALGGVGAAASKLAKSQGKSDEANKAAARQIADARKNLAKVIADNAEALVAANERITKAQIALNKAFEDGKEEVQQLGFAAEEAALSEKRASMTLEEAREALARVQDMPPNSRIRREAELAYAEAELHYREAIDANQDMAKEQQRINGDPKNTQGYIDAAQEMQDAEEAKAKAVIDAIQSEIDAVERLKQAIADAKKSNDKNDPLAGLTKSQREFAKYLAGLHGLMQAMKEDVAQGFLPVLADQMDRIIDSDALGTIRVGLMDMGVALGEAAKNFTDKFLEPENIAALGKVFDTAAYATEKFGSMAGSAFGAFVKILEVADPLTRRFVDFLDKKAGQFDKFISTKKASGELATFFARAGDIAADFGDIFGNIFGTLGNIIAANFEPGSGGDIMLQYFKEATQSWNDFGKTPEGIATLKDYFKGAAENLKSMLQVLGPVVMSIIKMGADPSVKEFWDTMGEGVPYLTKMMEAGMQAGPSLARLLVALTKIGSVLADSGSIQIFFDTLTFFADGVAKILENETVKQIINTIGQMGAFISALTLVGAIAMKIGGVIVGFASKMGMVFGVSTGVMLGIFALIAGLIWLYKTNEEFRKSVETMVAAVMPALTQLGTTISDMFTKLGPILADVVKHLSDLVIALMPLVTSILKTAIDLFSALVTPLMQFIPVIARVAEILIGSLITALMSIIPPVTQIVDVIGKTLVTAINLILPPLMTLISSLITNLLPVFTKIITVVGELVTKVITALVPVFIQISEAIIPIIAMIMEKLVPALTTIINAIVPLISTIVDALIPAFTTIIDNVMPIITMLVDMFLPVISLLIETVVDLAAQILAIVIPIFQFLAAVIGPVVTFLMAIVTAVLKFVMPILKVLIGIFAAVAAIIANIVIPIIAGLINFFIGGWGNIVKGFKGAINNMIGLVEGFVNFFIDGINMIIKAINKIKFDVPDWVPLIGGMKFGFNIPLVGKLKIPRLADGGTVMPSPGGTLAQIAEAGRAERVEPLDPNGLSNRDKAMIKLLAGNEGGGQVNITVNPAPGMNERELAALVSQEMMRQMRRGSI